MLLVDTMYLHFFFFNDPATTEIYTLSLHDALPICGPGRLPRLRATAQAAGPDGDGREGRLEALPRRDPRRGRRSEEHTSELQSQSNLVCRLLLEKKKNTQKTHA